MADAPRVPKEGDTVSCLFGSNWFDGYVMATHDTQEADKKTKKLQTVSKMLVYFPDDGAKHEWNICASETWRFAKQTKAFVTSVKKKLAALKKKEKPVKAKKPRKSRAKPAAKKKKEAKVKPPKPPPKKKKAPAKKRKPKRSFGPEDRRRTQPPTDAELAAQRPTPKKKKAVRKSEPADTPPKTGFFGNESNDESASEGSDSGPETGDEIVTCKAGDQTRTCRPQIPQKRFQQ